ncbi:MAG TPA: AEC family transporter, partial [Rhodocyclaceae bacterium]|nr:AEC family transporter [Rhodocyclaceae bacterium]
MLARIVAILFPVFAIAAAGYFVARRHKPDLSHANRLTMDVFAPALVFVALANRSFDFSAHRKLAVAMLLVVIGSGVVGALLARMAHVKVKTFVPPMMYGNSGNLGIPLAILAFGDGALPAAVVLFVTSTLVHFSYGAWLLDHNTRLTTIWRIPLILAAIAGIAVSLASVTVWAPLMLSIKMLGDIAIPLMLFALGARLTEVNIAAWRLGVFGGVARPVVGMLLSWMTAKLLGITGQDYALLFLFGAMPPAVLNYIFSERFNQEPDHV